MIDRLGDVLLAVPVLIAASAKVVQEESVGFWEKASRAQQLGMASLTGTTLVGLLVSAGVGLSTMLGLAPRVARLEAQHDTVMGNRSASAFRADHVRAVAAAQTTNESTLNAIEAMRNEIVCEVNFVLASDCSFWLNNGRPERLRRGGT
jgi:hypothetical protein